MIPVGKNSRDKQVLREWQTEEFTEDNYTPLSFEYGEVGPAARESDIKDRRKVLIFVASTLPRTHKYNGFARLAYGIEDAIWSWREGCEVYYYREALRLKFPSGLTLEFHRLEGIREEFIHKVKLADYLEGVYETGSLSQDRRIVLKERK